MRLIARYPLLFVLVYTFVIIASVAIIMRFLAASIEGAHVTSWWRNPWKNFEVGGLSGSAHLLGWAVDLTPVDAIVEAQARKVFPVVVNEGTHIHAAIFKA